MGPRDLCVRSADRVPEDFDPRRDATSRVYVYRVWNRPVRSPFRARFAWHVRQELDADAMSTAAAHLLGEQDFSSFRAAGCDAAHPVRRVLRSRVLRDDDSVVYEVEATAFLRHMVRNIVGTLVEVGRADGARTTSRSSSSGGTGRSRARPPRRTGCASSASTTDTSAGVARPFRRTERRLRTGRRCRVPVPSRARRGSGWHVPSAGWRRGRSG